MFTILVGRPGLGKGAAVNPAMAILREANTANVLSDKLTMPYVLEKLSKGFTGVQPVAAPPNAQAQSAAPSFVVGTDSSAILFAPELSVFTRNEDDLSLLSDLWDARSGKFDYGTRGKGLYSIGSPCLSMLAASAPEWMVKTIPQSAIGGGFTRRVNFVLAKVKGRNIPWPVSPNGKSLVPKLVEDLRHIHTHIYGEFKWSAPARQMFQIYHSKCIPQEFDDEATASYTTTKWAHAAKLAMVLSASRGDDLEISGQDFDHAIQRIEQVSKDIKTVFRGVGEGDLTSAADRVLKFLELKGYATRQQIMAVLWQTCTTMELEVVLKTLEDGNFVAHNDQGHQVVYKLVNP